MIRTQCETLYEFQQKYFRHEEFSCLNQSQYDRLPEVDKAEWVEALRSGKYLQGTNKLHYGDKYCCLGVKCAIDDRVKAYADFDDGIIAYDYGNESSTTSLPTAYAKEIGISGDGKFTYHFTYEGITFCHSTSLMTLNDDGFTFSQIADIIEYFF